MSALQASQGLPSAQHHAGSVSCTGTFKPDLAPAAEGADRSMQRTGSLPLIASGWPHLRMRTTSERLAVLNMASPTCSSYAHLLLNFSGLHAASF